MIALALIVILAAAGPSGSEIFEQADARIERHRTGEALLRLEDPRGEPLPAGGTVRIEQTNHAFLFGSNIYDFGKMRSPAENAAYEDYFAELFNYATLPFYWWAYEQRRGVTNRAKMRRVLKWCRNHEIRTKGHPLAWNLVDPRWLEPMEARKILDAQLLRIRREVETYAGKIDIWDVVNEATNFDRASTRKRGPLLTAMIEEVGVADYLRASFLEARRANPKAVLIINDYRVDEVFAERVVSKLVDESGNPLYDVIGIQSHQHQGAWSIPRIWSACESNARFGKPLHFTETTFVSGAQGRHLKEKGGEEFVWASTPEGERRQTEDVVRFYTLLFSHPAVEAITWWDFSDQRAWMGAPAGLLREDMTPKPAYWELRKLIKRKWWTTTESTVQEESLVGFRGFFGEYRVTLKSNGRRLSGTFSFDRDTSMPIALRLTPSDGAD
jgi:GH35 family endo-1,4-beta-xylanase